MLAGTSLSRGENDNGALFHMDIVVCLVFIWSVVVRLHQTESLSPFQSESSRGLVPNTRFRLLVFPCCGALVAPSPLLQRVVAHFHFIAEPALPNQDCSATLLLLTQCQPGLVPVTWWGLAHPTGDGCDSC